MIDEGADVRRRCRRGSETALNRPPTGMVVFGGPGHVRGVILGAVLLTALPEVLRYVAGPLQAMTDGRLDAGILRPLLVSLAMIVTMLMRPHGLWPAPAEGGAAPVDQSRK